MNINFAYKILNNTNIVNQEGMFFFNNNPTVPVEENYIESINSIKETLEEDEFEKLNYNEHLATCWNIHKSLKPYILAKLKEKGLSQSFIYPDNTNLKEFTLQTAMEEI